MSKGDHVHVQAGMVYEACSSLAKFSIFLISTSQQLCKSENVNDVLLRLSLMGDAGC